MEERALTLLVALNKEEQKQSIKRSIQNKTREDMDRQQREYFLQQQMQTIQKELGGNSPEKDINDFRKRANAKKWDAKVKDVFEKE